MFRRMRYSVCVLAAAIGLVAACHSSPNSSTATSTTPAKTLTSTVSPATTTASSGLQQLVPVPANTARTDGPDSLHDNGIHLHFYVNGSPMDVMGAYKTALLGKNWSLIVDSSSGGGGGGGATYTASNGDAFGVFTGGGFGGTTDVDACVWPAKPANADCGRR
jgi:hypothetical protein